MEARLGVALGAQKSASGAVAAEPAVGDDEGESTTPVSEPRSSSNDAENAGQKSTPLDGDGAPNAWPDESTEAAILGELRERGEKPTPPSAAESVEESEPKNLPPLDELVKRLSPAVRETLDDLFRARFVTVRRLPAKALSK